MRHTMMDLEVGKYYLLVQTGGCLRKGRIESKRADDERSHTYMMAWPHPTGPNPYGIYVHDHGWAKHLEYGQEIETYFSVTFPNAVYAYRELLESEYMSMKLWFEERKRERQAWVDAVNRGAWGFDINKWNAKRS